MHVLHHINIVTMLAIIFELGHYGLLMEYVLHGALDDFLFHYDVCCSVSSLFKSLYLFISNIGFCSTCDSNSTDC